MVPRPKPSAPSGAPHARCEPVLAAQPLSGSICRIAPREPRGYARTFYHARSFTWLVDRLQTPTADTNESRAGSPDDARAIPRVVSIVRATTRPHLLHCQPRRVRGSRHAPARGCQASALIESPSKRQQDRCRRIGATGIAGLSRSEPPTRSSPAAGMPSGRPAWARADPMAFDLSSHLEPGGAGDRPRGPSMDGADDLAAIDAPQVDAGDAKVGMLDMRVIWRLDQGFRRRCRCRCCVSRCRSRFGGAFGG